MDDLFSSAVSTEPSGIQRLLSLPRKTRDVAYCHGVRYRLETGFSVALLQEQYSRMASRYFNSDQPVVEAVVSHPLWIETVPGQAHEPLAIRRREVELLKPISPSSNVPIRTVLLQYQDGTADLIIVARRSRFDYRSLLLLGDAVIGGCSLTPQNVADTVSVHETVGKFRTEEPLECEYSQGPDWALAEPDQKSLLKRFRFELADNELGCAASWLAAVGITVGKYSGGQACEVATLVTDSRRPLYKVGAYERLTHIPITVRDSVCKQLLKDIAVELHSADDSAQGTQKDFVPAMFVFDNNADLIKSSEYQSSLNKLYSLMYIRDTDRDGRTHLECQYHSRSFDSSVIRHFTQALIFVHRQLITDPLANVKSLNLLSQEHHRQVSHLGCTVAASEPVQRIDQFFAVHARANPEAPALSFEDQKLTYQALHEQSNQVAHVLRACGVMDGDLVGVCLERSLDLVVMLLAVLKSGATYVPLDPAYPQERLAYTVENARILLVITALESFPGQVQLMHPQDIYTQSNTYPLTEPETSTSAQDPAYVIYTSGSTGKPKGVVVPHCNVLNLLAGTVADFGLSAADTWTLFHSSAFDFSVWEMWGCLLTGGHLVVVPYWVSRSAREFHELLVREQVTVLSQTPTAFSQLIEADESSTEPLALRLVVFGGEPLDTGMLLRWFDRRPESACRMVNMFGITETTVHVTAETITRGEALKATRSVGRALDGWHIYIMDESGQLLPPGIAGEIYVAGAGVALEYLNQPQLTAQRFIIGPGDTGRLYRSGDKGRLRPDGRLEHLGRLDSQIKLRGFRIELDEIRSVLLQVNEVVAAAVVLNQVRPDDSASARLDAYLVLDGGSVSEVRQHASKFLPDYMLPATFTALKALPLTANGKLDVKALPVPTLQVALHTVSKDVALPAGNAIIQSLISVWEAVLGVPVGMDDNFFELGGNSLYAVRIDAMLREQHLPSIPMREIYIQQTIRNLTDFLQANDSERRVGEPDHGG